MLGYVHLHQPIMIMCHVDPRCHYGFKVCCHTPKVHSIRHVLELAAMEAMSAQPPHARVYRWEVEDSDEKKDELETAAASCDHLVAMGSESST